MTMGVTVWGGALSECADRFRGGDERGRMPVGKKPSPRPGRRLARGPALRLAQARRERRCAGRERRKAKS